MNRTGDELGDLHQSVAAGGERWPEPTIRNWSGLRPYRKGHRPRKLGRGSETGIKK